MIWNLMLTGLSTKGSLIKKKKISTLIRETALPVTRNHKITLAHSHNRKIWAPAIHASCRLSS